MAEYIDKQAFNDAIREAIRRYPSTFYNGLETARQIAHNLPSADVQPVRHGAVAQTTAQEIVRPIVECAGLTGTKARWR